MSGPETNRASGRPSDFTSEIADEICARIIESDYGLEQICEADDMPSARTVYRWLAADETFRQQYARAKEAQGHVQADRGLKDALTASDASIGRLKFDARRWAASKLASKVYGDRQQHEHTGKDGGPIEYAKLTPEQRRARIAELQGKLSGAERSGGD